MKKQVLHMILVIALVGLTLSAAAQPAVLPVWVPEAQKSSSTMDESTEQISFGLPAMAILDVQGPAVVMSLVDPIHVGTVLSEVISSTSWLNYTSIVPESTTNKISVEISRGTVPTGTALRLSVADNAGVGDGDFGEIGESINLTSFAQDIITGIESCYTGTGIGNGRRISYSWITNPDQYSNITAGQKSVTVTYTITSVVPGE